MRRVLYAPIVTTIDGANPDFDALDACLRDGRAFIVTMPDNPYAVCKLDAVMLDKCGLVIDLPTTESED